MFTIVSFERDRCSLSIRCLVVCRSSGLGVFWFVLMFRFEGVCMGLLNPDVGFCCIDFNNIWILDWCRFCDERFRCSCYEVLVGSSIL